VERGSRLSLATPSASARAILAFSADEVVARVLGGKLDRNTPTTVIEPARIRAILVETRGKGVAVVHGENQQQLSAVAAPVRNANGKCIGAIALSGLTLRFQGEALKRMLQLVRAESKDIEARLAVPSRSAQRDESSGAQVAVLRPKRARRR
jgi:DNA-binding IclR family transcriptional regulator